MNETFEIYSNFVLKYFKPMCLCETRMESHIQVNFFYRISQIKMAESGVLANIWHDLRKLLIVLYWKNFTLKCRHYVMTLLEITVPTLLFVAVLAVFLWGGKNLSPSPQNVTQTETAYLHLEYCKE